MAHRHSLGAPVLFALYLVTFFDLSTCQNPSEFKVLYTMAEENTPNMRLGNIAVDAGLDVKYGQDVLQLLRFSFLSQQASPHQHFFSIGETTGILVAAKTVDRDLICPNKVVCRIPLDISVQPGQYFEIIKVAVTIQDINDNSPTFPSPTIDRSISEASQPGSSISIPEADDPDSPMNGIKRYELITNISTFGLKVQNNTDGTTNINLVLKEELDREKVGFYQVQVNAYDTVKSGSVMVNINVLDVNDNNPKFDNQTYETYVFENVPKFTTILKVNAQDPDAGDNGEIVYSFTTKTQREFGGLFAIDETTGDIYVTETLDYEDGAMYNLDVSAKDKGMDALPSLAKVIVHVKDLNDHAPQITVNTDSAGGVVHIFENSDIGAFVAHITVVDADGGEFGKFNCTISDTTNFQLKQLYQTEFKIISKVVFDREQRANYSINLQCRDRAQPPLVSTQTIIVNIADFNDHKPVFSKNYYEAVIQENNEVGAAILTVNATDDDVGLNGAILYSIERDIESMFQIGSTTGVITAAVSLDHERIRSVEFQVTARDQGNPPQSATVPVMIKIADVDDEAPKFSSAAYVFSVAENQPAKSFVGQVSATDPDSEPYNSFVFSIDPVYNADNLFDIESDTGKIFTTKPLDRESKKVYNLVVKAVSIGNINQSNKTHVFVSILDENDNGPVIDFPNPMNNTVYVFEDTAVGYVIARISARDNDSGPNSQLSYNISSNSKAAKYFSIDQSTGAIILSNEINGANVEEGAIKLTISVQDKGIPFRTAEAILNVIVNKSLASPPIDAAMISNTNLTIVISIASISGILMVILIIAIVIILHKQYTTDKRKKKYNYVPRMVDSKLLSGDNTKPMVNGTAKAPNGLLPGQDPSRAHIGRNVSLQLSQDNKENMKNEDSMEKPDYPPSERSEGSNSVFTDIESGNKRPSRQSSWNEDSYPPRVIYPPEHVIHKPWVVQPQHKSQLTNIPQSDKDSDSACSADNTTDSGRGSNDDGSDNHFAHGTSQEAHGGTTSPPSSPTKEGRPPPKPSINTKSLNTGVHRSRTPSMQYRDSENPHTSGSYHSQQQPLPQRRTNSHTQQYLGPDMDLVDYRNIVDPRNPHPDHLQNPNSHSNYYGRPHQTQPDVNMKGRGGGKYQASHV